MNDLELKTNSAKDKKLEKFKQSLPKQHVIYTMIEEHEKIFDLLDKLYLTNEKIQKNENINLIKIDFIQLHKILELIIKSDSHHQREELVLFPQLEILGFFGHPYIKKLEHDQIRDYLEELFVLSSNFEVKKINMCKKRVNTLVRFLIIKLKENMNDENDSIYPKAVEVIKDKEIWKIIKEKCDRIGYFKFENDL